MNQAASGGLRRRLIAGVSITAAAALALTGCSGGASGSTASGGSGDEKIGVSLIVKTTSNPFFVAMQDGAKEAADELGVDLTLAAGKEDGDEDTQIQAIENAISKGDAGILITPNGPGVEDGAAGREVAGEEGEADRRVAVAEGGHLGVVGGGPGVVGRGDLGAAGGGVDRCELVGFAQGGLAVDGVVASIVISAGHGNGGERQ